VVLMQGGVHVFKKNWIAAEGEPAQCGRFSRSNVPSNAAGILPLGASLVSPPLPYMPSTIRIQRGKRLVVSSQIRRKAHVYHKVKPSLYADICRTVRGFPRLIFAAGYLLDY
jgi:hypothetical protein